MTRTRTPQKPTRKQGFGTPGTSARAAYRTQRSRFAHASNRQRLQMFVFGALVGAVVAVAAGWPMSTGVVLAAAGMTGAAGLLLLPRVWPVLAVLGISLFLSIPVGAFYAASTRRIWADTASAWTALMVIMFLSTWAAARWSRGRAWVTLVAVYGGILAALPIAVAVPGLGVNAARLAALLIIMFRCGAWDWLAGAAGLAVARIRDWKQRGLKIVVPDAVAPDETPDALDVVSPTWLRRASAEQATATALHGLDSTHAVFHDVRTRRGARTTLHHVVVGPAGVFLGASVTSHGLITESAKEGLYIPGVDVGQEAGNLVAGRNDLARALRMRASDITMFLVVHGASDAPPVLGLRRQLGAFSSREETHIPDAHLLLVSPDMLMGEISNGFATLSPLTREMALRRARMQFSPAATGKGHASALPARVAAFTDDGQVTAPVMQASTQTTTPGFEAGSLVRVAGGQRGSYRIMSSTGRTFVDSNGEQMLLLAVTNEYKDAVAAGRDPQAEPYPMHLLRPERPI